MPPPLVADVLMPEVHDIVPNACWCAGARHDHCGQDDTNCGELVTPYRYYRYRYFHTLPLVELP
jgi:hypothetical protein